MGLIAFVFFGGALALTCWVYYLLFGISIAIWFPGRAKPKWIAQAESPPIQIVYPVFKWLVPIWLILLPIYVVTQVLKYILTGTLQ